jgi:hypothetical protein
MTAGETESLSLSLNMDLGAVGLEKRTYWVSQNRKKRDIHSIGGTQNQDMSKHL